MSGGDEGAQVQAALTGKCVVCGRPLATLEPRQGVPEPHGWCFLCAHSAGWHQCGTCAKWLPDSDLHYWPNDRDWDWWCDEHAGYVPGNCDCRHCTPDVWCSRCGGYVAENDNLCRACFAS